MSRYTDTLELIRAGYSKSEIEAMLQPDAITSNEGVPVNSSPITDAPAAELAAPTQPASPAPAVDVSPAPAPAGVTLTASQFEQLLQRANLASATFDLPPVRSAGDVAHDRLTNLIGGIE